MTTNTQKAPNDQLQQPEKDTETKTKLTSEPLTKRRSGAPLYAPDELSKKIWEIVARMPVDKQKGLGLEKLENPSPYRPQKTYESDGVRYTKVRIEDVPAYCQAIGVTIPDLFRECGHAFEWPTEGAKKLQERLSKLSQQKLNWLRGIVIELSPSYWLPWSEQGREPNPRKRALTALERYPEWNSRKKAILQSKYVSPSLADYLKLSKALEVSPPWLFGWLNDTTASLASHDVEFIITGYLFAHGNNRKIIEAVVDLED